MRKFQNQREFLAAFYWDYLSSEDFKNKSNLQYSALKEYFEEWLKNCIEDKDFEEITQAFKETGQKMDFHKRLLFEGLVSKYGSFYEEISKKKNSLIKTTLKKNLPKD